MFVFSEISLKIELDDEKVKEELAEDTLGVLQLLLSSESSESDSMAKFQMLVVVPNLKQSCKLSNSINWPGKTR